MTIATWIKTQVVNAPIHPSRILPFAVSDNVMASLSIYHGNSVATVRGYRHCLGADSKAISDRALPIEKQRLLEVEALIDSVAIRTGRFATRQPNER